MQLRERHRLRAGAEQGERGARLARQELFGLERQELAELHRRAAQPREALRQPAHVRAGQQRFAGPEPLALGEPPDAFRQTAERELAGRQAEPEQAADAGRRNARSPPGRTFAQARRQRRGTMSANILPEAPLDR